MSIKKSSLILAELCCILIFVLFTSIQQGLLGLTGDTAGGVNRTSTGTNLQSEEFV